MGQEVVFCLHAHPPRGCDVTSTQIGRIDSWETDEDGEIDVIRVRWPDGRLIDYQPLCWNSLDGTNLLDRRMSHRLAERIRE